MRTLKAPSYTLALAVALAASAGCSGSGSQMAPTPAVPRQSIFGSNIDKVSESASGRPKYILVGSIPDQSILVFKATATGPAKPVATIAGNNTKITDPSDLFIARSQLWVSNYATSGGSIEAFNKHGRGNIAPEAEITGSKTRIGGQASVYVLPSGGIISSSTASNSLEIFRAGSNGNVRPARTISGSLTQLNNPNSIWVDPASKDILVASPGLGSGPGNGILAFSATAKGNAAPLYTIAGSNTTLCQPIGLVIDSQGLIYVTNRGCTPAILVFAAGAKGNVAPIRTIVGSKTTLKDPRRIRVDALGYTYVSDYQDQSVKVFPPGASGNTAPVQNITNIPTPGGLELQ